MNPQIWIAKHELWNIGHTHNVLSEYYIIAETMHAVRNCGEVPQVVCKTPVTGLIA